MESFMARQPIFNRGTEVYAYELLFRSSLDNYFSHPNPDYASSRLIADSFLTFDFDKLSGGKRAFINVTEDVLTRDYLTLLPKKHTVFEILETVRPTPEVVAACRRLKDSGFLLALDDFVYHKHLAPLVELADIVKVDFLETPPADRQRLADDLGPRGIRLLAEKLETQDAFDHAVSMGFDYFQGYFFSKPVIFRRSDIPSFKLHYMQVIQEIHKTSMDFERLESIIKQDFSLSYKLIRYVNSPFFGLRGKVHSIQQVLYLLGEKEIKRWATLVAVTSMADDKPLELVIQSVIRGKFCESLGGKAGNPGEEHDLFLLGMFSMLDAIMDKPMVEILEDIPIAPDIRDALLGKQNWYREILNIAIRYERGDWEAFANCCANLIETGKPSRTAAPTSLWKKKRFRTFI